jgi:hypothetical protein
MKRKGRANRPRSRHCDRRAESSSGVKPATVPPCGMGRLRMRRRPESQEACPGNLNPNPLFDGKSPGVNCQGLPVPHRGIGRLFVFRHPALELLSSASPSRERGEGVPCEKVKSQKSNVKSRQLAVGSRQSKANSAPPSAFSCLRRRPRIPKPEPPTPNLWHRSPEGRTCDCRICAPANRGERQCARGDD